MMNDSLDRFGTKLEKRYSKKEIKNQRLNYSKIKKDLKWEPKTTLYNGLIKTISWYKKNISEFK